MVKPNHKQLIRRERRDNTKQQGWIDSDPDSASRDSANQESLALGWYTEETVRRSKYRETEISNDKLAQQIIDSPRQMRQYEDRGSIYIDGASPSRGTVNQEPILLSQYIESEPMKEHEKTEALHDRTVSQLHHVTERTRQYKIDQDIDSRSGNADNKESLSLAQYSDSKRDIQPEQLENKITTENGPQKETLHHMTQSQI